MKTWCVEVVGLGFLIALWAGLPASVQAAEIRVALDGSGDYDVLQDAVAAAQSGDTISIAPGEYTQTRVVTSESGNLIEVMAHVTQRELTIVGDDRDAVVIGPAVPADNLATGPDGIQDTFGSSLTVRGITVRNVNVGVSAIGTNLFVADCNVHTCEIGIGAAVTGGTHIWDSSISDVKGQGIAILDVQGESPAIIQRCVITDTGIGIDMQTEGNLVADCSVVRGTVGIQASFAGSAQIVNCTLQDQGNVGIGVLGGSSVFASSNRISGSAQCIFVSGALSGSGNQLMGGTFATLRIGGQSALDFHDNHILNAGGWSVHTVGGSLNVWPIDLTNNFWGSEDSDQIADWIYDRNDSNGTWLLVDFEPFHGQPVRTEETSFGRVKAAFGQ